MFARGRNTTLTLGVKKECNLGIDVVDRALQSQGDSQVVQDFQIVFRSKAIALVLAASAAFRLLFFIFLPQTPSILGPDEGTYARLARYVSNGLDVNKFPEFGPELYNSSKSFILPGALLIKSGMNELDAVRAISSIYGWASLLMLSLTYVAIQRKLSSTQFESNLSFDKKSIFLVGLFAFVPSNFIWSTIGLRESGSQFWLMITLYFLTKLTLAKGWEVSPYAILMIASLTLATGTRPETALIFSITFLLYSLFLVRRVPRFVAVISMLVGIFLGQSFTATPKINEESRTPKIIQQEWTDALSGVQSQFSRVKHFELKRNTNALNAESALPQSSCVNSSSNLALIIKCHVSELPYRLFAFIFRPLLFFDSGSTTLMLAAIENIGWAFLVGFGIYGSFSRTGHATNRLIKLSLFSYFLLFSTAAALYEGNLGTAFRHKSSILWPLILVLMLSQFSFSVAKRKNN